MTKTFERFYINGKWVAPTGPPNTLDVINPATEEPYGRIALGTKEDVALAVQAAGAAFDSWSQTAVESRLNMLEKIVAGIQNRYEELTEVVSKEMGAPLWLAKAAQVAAGMAHFATAAEVLKNFRFEAQQGTTLIVKEPIGVCGFITPWNWPLNQIACKVAPALAAGCTIVLKPSEIAPLNACILAEIIHDAGVPAGVFNLVNGDGSTVGAALSAHPGVDMVSFTGSTRAGILVARAAADGVKRVTQELGGNFRSGALQEIFGPVLCIMPYQDEDDAVRIANDSPYGLSGYVSSGDPNRARRVAARLRTGNVHLNGSGVDFQAPFGGYKQSGNGREWGKQGFEEFLETKAIMGWEGQVR